MQNTHNSEKYNSNHQNTKGILLNVQTAMDMGPTKIIYI
jgi:hypothetical protein